MSGPAAEFDSVIGVPTRLWIVATLAEAEWATFGFVRDQVGVSDSVLSKQLGTLEKSGYIQLHKGHVGRAPRTWARLTSLGRHALTSYVDALRQLTDRT